MSNPASEVEGGEKEEGDVAAAAAATLSAVSRLLLARQAGGNTELERDTEKEDGRCCVLFELRYCGTRCRRNAVRKWILALDTELQIHGLPAVSNVDCYCHSTNPLVIFNRGVNPPVSHGGGSGPTGREGGQTREALRFHTFFLSACFPPFLSVRLCVSLSVSLMLLLGSLQEGCWRLMWLTLA